MSKSRWIEGNASETTELSSTIMNSETESVPSAHHLRFESVTRLTGQPLG